MDSKLKQLHAELHTRLKSACSPNELLGYMAAMLYVSEYSSELTLHDLDDLEVVKTHFLLWGRCPGREKLATLSRYITCMIQKINHPIIFKVSSVLDHAEAILDIIEEDDCFLSNFIPSEN